jgi:N-acetylmuramoyl-L-alanine amidase
MRFHMPFFALALAASTAQAQSTIAVDVGHYADAPGATSARGRPELEFNRDLARDIAAALANQGFSPRLIGEDGGMLRLTDRSRAARGAALLLSVHHDSVQPQFLQPWVSDGGARLYSDRAAGFSLFISAKNPQPAKSLACASAIGAALRGKGVVHSPHHAERIAGEMKRYADRVNGVHFYDNLVVLKTAQQPALLIEAGVIVHRDEELRVSDPRWRAAFAQAVADGVAACQASRP